jgi:N4-gp56 family major capsid protein
MASTGSFNTSVPSSSALARKLFSVALFAQTQKQPGFTRTLTGPAPSTGDAINKLKAQTSKDMPVVRITDLSKTAGDKVSVDVFGTIGGKPIVGDADAEGTGVALTNASMDIRIDLLTKVVDAGGKMSQKRTVHDLRNIAMANLTSYFARLDDQTTLVHLAGARGTEMNEDWVVPLASDGDFGAIMVNDVVAPSYGNHFLIDNGGASLAEPSVANIGAIASTDVLTLESIDNMRTMLDEMAFPLQPVKIADDPAAADEPMWVLYVTPRQYSHLLKATSNDIRSFQQNAWNRASYGSKHPLFKGEVGMWNGILVKKLNRAIRFGTGSSMNHVVAANKATAAETTTALPATIDATHALDRAILLGAQALGNCYGKNKGSDYHFDWLENPYNFGRALEVGGDCMGGKAKLRFNLGGTHVKDHGVMCFDSVVSLT